MSGLWIRSPGWGVLQAYKAEAQSGRGNTPARLAIGINDGPYRLRTADEAGWAASYAYSQRSTTRRVLEAVRVGGRMILPVLGLSSALAAVFLFIDMPVPGLKSEAWLSVSHLLLPLAFLVIHLTNRRYGPGYAFWQVVGSFVLLASLTALSGGLVHHLLPPSFEPTAREVAAFGIAFLLAGFLSIVAFDGARGPRWWTAPLIGSIAGMLVFTSIFYPAAYAGTSTAWINHMGVHAGLLAASALLMLLPYWLLRRMVEPLAGYGGY